ncbi:LOW QUALITY PROTEIN: hypothetical protein PanWU01x14_185230 [Parasponia andersonii]|uniref:RNase H type-1 domain-containing protein n=1 Tax=Parasponia andersonii TaxID=3476 RepID=A0A2P5C498_PARAD|nr:LOW QUALITY PROTEIN: hypothetical protein PanWU01x14_185230 [Parasponia andersonii]
MDMKRPYCKINRNIKWKPLEIDKLKLNVDVAVTIGCGFIGISRVVNSEGWVVVAVAHRTIDFYDPLIAECIAFRECLQFCFESNVHPDLIEIDSTICCAAEAELLKILIFNTKTILNINYQLVTEINKSRKCTENSKFKNKGEYKI